MDYFRTDCIKSYFEIVALVNKGNRKINEQTEAKFFIEQDKLFLGINEKQKVQLCKKEVLWVPSGSGHNELEQFVCRLLREENMSKLDEIIKRNLFKLTE